MSLSELVERGFVYVANTRAYIDEAVSSVRSLKAVMPDELAALIAPRSLWEEARSYFDLLIEPTLADQTPIVKNDAPLAPFKRVVFVDTDTRFLMNYSRVFDILDAFDIAAAHEPTRGWDYSTSAAIPFCELNTGLIAFNNVPHVRDFFAQWLVNYRKMLQDQGLRNDQPSFRQTLWERRDIRLAVLPTEFHAIVGKPCYLAWDALMLHGRGDLVLAGNQINRSSGYRAYLPGLGCLFPFTGRRRLLLDWLRLTRSVAKGILHPNQSFGMVPVGRRLPHRWYLGESDEGNLDAR